MFGTSRLTLCAPPVSSALRDKGFVLQERGEIEVKGKGRMTTYFLLRNLGASEQDIMGLAGPGAESPQPHSRVAGEPHRLQGTCSGPGQYVFTRLLKECVSV